MYQDRTVKNRVWIWNLNFKCSFYCVPSIHMNQQLFLHKIGYDRSRFMTPCGNNTSIFHHIANVSVQQFSSLFTIKYMPLWKLSITAIQSLSYHFDPELTFLSFPFFFSLFIVISYSFGPSHQKLPITEPTSTNKPTLNAMPEVNRATLVHFVEPIKTNKFRVHFHICRLNEKQFLKWIMVSYTVPGKKIVNAMMAMASARFELWKLTIFARFPDPTLHELDTEQACQELKASFAVATWALKDPRTRELIYTHFRSSKVS